MAISPSRNDSSSDNSRSSDVTRLSARSADQADRHTESVPPDEDVLLSRKRLGDFLLIRQIGHGGMGVVYEAEQLSLARKVAVKILPFAAMLNQQHRKRFHNEARAVATLDHPNIVPVYFVGEERGVHFYAMHLIEGQSVAQLIESLRGECPGQAPSADKYETVGDLRSVISTQRSSHRDEFFLTVAHLGAEAAEGLEHAHQVGILHRDIKPGNLMVDTSRKLWITDFGLASIEHGETLTRTGGVIGTAAYMSPEQASDSHRIDGRSDVYSLGATLYELLTLRRHRSDDATRVAPNSEGDKKAVSSIRFDSKIPIDLETIVIKALAVDPLDRYQTAGAMADDLRSFIAGREIRARRLTLVQRQARWLRRHRRLTTAVITTSCLLMAGLGAVSLVYSRQLSNHARQLELALMDAQESHIEAEKQTRLAKQQLARAERSEKLALASEQSARQSEMFARRMSYRTDMQRAYDSFARHNLFDASRSLARQVPKEDLPELRGVEWRLLNAEVNAKLWSLGSHSGPTTACVLYPDGNTVATTGVDGLVHLWDIESKAIRRSLEPKIGPIHAMAISPDGSTLAVGGAPAAGLLASARIHLLDSDTGVTQALVQHHKTTIESIRFSPDGKLIAAGSRYQEVELSTVDGLQLHSFDTDQRNENIAFSADSKYLLTSWRKANQLCIWECSTGVAIGSPIQCHESVASFDWLPSGRCIVVAGSTQPWIHAYDVESGKTLASLSVSEPRPKAVRAIAISGDTIAAGDTHGKLHQWIVNEASWREYLESEGNYSVVDPLIDPMAVDDDGVMSIVHLANGSIFTAHESGSVKLSTPEQTSAQLHSLDFDTTSVVVSSDRLIFLGSPNGSIHRFDLETERATELSPATDSGVVDLAITELGTRLAVAYQSGRVDLVNLATGKILWSQEGGFEGDDAKFHVALAPDGRTVARAGDDKQLLVWETDQQRMKFSKPFPGVGWAIAFSRDGRLVAHGQEEIHLFRVDSGDLVHRFRGASVEDLQFSLAQQILAGGHGDGSIRLFDLVSGEERILRGFATDIRSVAFSEDDRTIIGAEFNRDDEAIQLWEVESGEAYGEIANPLDRKMRGHESSSKIFAVDGQVIVCAIGGPDTKIAVWDLAR